MKVFNRVKEIFPGAQWLWEALSDRDERDRRIYFRKSFQLDELPVLCELKITADAAYQLYVNGIYVTRGPARGFQECWSFDRVNIAPYLKTGKNVLAVRGYQFGVSNYSYNYAWAQGILVSGSVDGLSLSSDASWKYQTDTGYISAVARASGQYAWQEFCDCRKMDDRWLETDFDDTDWPDHCPGRSVGCMPWHDFKERDIPLLTNDLLPVRRIVSWSKHSPAPGWEENKDIRFYANGEQEDWRPYGKEITGFQFTPEETSLVLDFGEELMGTIIFHIENANEGEKFDFHVFEYMDGLTPHIPKNIPVPTNFGGRLILRAGTNDHETTIPWGFRFIQVSRRDSSRIRVKVTARRVIYDLNVQAEFRSNVEIWNRIWDICERTQRCCMNDAHVDCPWRENAQWWGDAFVQVKNTVTLSTDLRLFERGLRMIAFQRTPDGLTYAMAPTCGHHCVLPDYSLIWIITLYEHYFQSGSLRLWDELKEAADGIFRYFAEQSATGEGLVYFDDRYWLFLDWCPTLHKNGMPTVLNLFYLRALQCAGLLADAAGDSVRRECFRQAETALSRALRKAVYDSGRKCLYDGLSYDGEIIRTVSPHTAALTILTGLAPEAEQNMVEHIILPFLRGNHEEPILPSIYFSHYIFEAAKKKGYGFDVLHCIERWWGKFVDQDFSTTPEHWNCGDASACHAWSAHPLHHYKELLAGVRQLVPGWEKVSFNPLTMPGKKLSAKIPTPKGIIHVHWDHTGQEVIRNIELPDGIGLF